MDLAVFLFIVTRQPFCVDVVVFAMGGSYAVAGKGE